MNRWHVILRIEWNSAEDDERDPLWSFLKSTFRNAPCTGPRMEREIIVDDTVLYGLTMILLLLTRL